MQILKDQFICGIPVKQLRDFLRKYPMMTLETFIQANLCSSLTAAKRVVHDLVKEGFIELYSSSSSTKWWITTVHGNALGKTKFVKPIEKPQAFILLNGLLERVTEVNQNNDYLLGVEYVGLFGSLSNPHMTQYNDVDLIILLKRKSSPEKTFWSFHKFLTESSKTIKYLRAKSPYLDFQEGEDQITTLGLSPTQLFPVCEWSYSPPFSLT